MYQNPLAESNALAAQDLLLAALIALYIRGACGLELSICDDQAHKKKAAIAAFPVLSMSVSIFFDA